MKGIKLVIIGDHGVGKTSFIHSLLGYPFCEHYVPTTTVDKYVVQNGTKLYTIFDNFQFSNIHEGIEGIIVMGSVITHKSIDYWKYKAEKTGLPIVTILNKSDLLPYYNPNVGLKTDEIIVSCKNKTNIYSVLNTFELKHEYSMHDPIQKD